MVRRIASELTRLFTLTNRIELQPMANKFVTQRIRNLLLNFFNGLVAELNDVATIDIDEMIMVLSRHLFVTSTTIAKVVAIKDIGFLKQLNRTVYRRNRDPLIVFRSTLVDLFDIRVIFGIRKHLGDDTTLLGHLQPLVYAQLFKA